MCDLPFKYRNVLEVLLKLMELCDPMGGQDCHVVEPAYVCLCPSIFRRLNNIFCSMR